MSFKEKVKSLLNLRKKIAVGVLSVILASTSIIALHNKESILKYVNTGQSQAMVLDEALYERSVEYEHQEQYEQSQNIQEQVEKQVNKEQIVGSKKQEVSSIKNIKNKIMNDKVDQFKQVQISVQQVNADVNSVDIKAIPDVLTVQDIKIYGEKMVRAVAEDKNAPVHVMKLSEFVNFISKDRRLVEKFHISLDLNRLPDIICFKDTVKNKQGEGKFGYFVLINDYKQPFNPERDEMLYYKEDILKQIKAGKNQTASEALGKLSQYIHPHDVVVIPEVLTERDIKKYAGVMINDKNIPVHVMKLSEFVEFINKGQKTSEFNLSNLHASKLSDIICFKDTISNKQGESKFGYFVLINDYKQSTQKEVFYSKESVLEQINRGKNKTINDVFGEYFDLQSKQQSKQTTVNVFGGVDVKKVDVTKNNNTVLKKTLIDAHQFRVKRQQNQQGQTLTLGR